MKIKKFCVSATIVGAQVLFWAGCDNNHPDPDKIVNEAVVAVMCENIVSNGMVYYRVSEIWKDESGGRFVFGTNDIIDAIYQKNENENIGQKSLLLHDGSGDKKNFWFTEGMNIHNGRLPALGGMSVSELKEKFMRGKKDAKPNEN